MGGDGGACSCIITGTHEVQKRALDSLEQETWEHSSGPLQKSMFLGNESSLDF